MFDQAYKTITAGDQAGPGASPIPGDFSVLSNFNKSSFQAPYYRSGASQVTTQNAVNDANSQAGAVQKAQAINDRLKEIQRLQDPKNYKIVSKQDGGFDYQDPAGKPITLAQYSAVTGKDPASVLKDSTNSLDIQYVNDFNNLQKLINLRINNDPKWEDFAKGLGGDTLVKTLKDTSNPADTLIKNFTQYYPNVYSNLPWNQYDSAAQVNKPGTFAGFK